MERVLYFTQEDLPALKLIMGLDITVPETLREIGVSEPEIAAVEQLMDETYKLLDGE